MMGRRVSVALFVVVLGLSTLAAPSRVVAADPVLAGAGDISDCWSGNDEATARLLDAIDPSLVFTLGDSVNADGTAQQYADCYGPTWGRHKGSTRPSVGNHDYLTSGAAGYFGYFGSVAAAPDGWYGYDVGAWHVVVLNGNCDQVGGCDAGSAQAAWLRADLAAHPTDNLLAYWHQPRFSSGNHGSDDRYQPFWDILYDAHADIVLNGHDHDYERFALQDPSGNADSAGIRQFVVGTGGTEIHGRSSSLANSQVFSSTYGVLKLTLHSTSYDWAFVPIAGSSFTDSGTTATHRNGTTPGPTTTRRTFNASSDTWVNQARKGTTYGTSTRLVVDGDVGSGLDARTYIKFSVTGLSGTVTRAVLRLWVTNATGNGPVILPTSTSWSGKTLTWANQPKTTGPVAFDAGAIKSGRWYDFNVTSLITGNRGYSFVLRPMSSDGVQFSSMQGTYPPRLIVDTVPAS